MSLKSFHLAFIAISALLGVVLAGYAFTSLAGPMRFLWSLTAIAAVVAIIFYGMRFRRKMQDTPFQ